MSKALFKHGDIFALPLPDGHFLFGRVILDIYMATKQRLFPADSPLPGLGKAVLIEMYREPSPTDHYTPSEVMIAGAFTESDYLGKEWPIVGNERVHPEDVSFPESLVAHMHARGEVAFECGEMRIPIGMTMKEHDEIGVYKTRLSGFHWQYYCIHELGRESEIPDEHREYCNLRSSDLRFTESREKIYEFLPIDINDKYFDQQAQLGLKLERVYE